MSNPLALFSVSIFCSLICLLPGDSAQPIARGELALGDVPYFAATSTPLPITLPANMTTGAYRLAGSLVSGTEEIGRASCRERVYSNV